MHLLVSTPSPHIRKPFCVQSDARRRTLRTLNPFGRRRSSCHVCTWVALASKLLQTSSPTTCPRSESAMPDRSWLTIAPDSRAICRILPYSLFQSLLSFPKVALQHHSPPSSFKVHSSSTASIKPSSDQLPWQAQMGMQIPPHVKLRVPISKKKNSYKNFTFQRSKRFLPPRNRLSFSSPVSSSLKIFLHRIRWYSRSGVRARPLMQNPVKKNKRPSHKGLAPFGGSRRWVPRSLRGLYMT